MGRTALRRALAILAAGLLGLAPQAASTVESSHIPGHVIHLVRDGWELDYQQVVEDGLVITDARYNGREVLDDYRVPQVWVDYVEHGDVADDFFQITWLGCLVPIVPGGFRIYCDYKFGAWDPNVQMCGTYYYRSSVYFYSSGEVRPNLIVYGPGFAATTIIYQVPYRQDFDIDVASPNYFYRWESVWALKSTEGDYFDDFNNRNGFKSGAEWRVRDNSGIGRSYYVDPRDTDGGSATGHGPSMYVLRTHVNETEPQDDSTPLTGYLNGENVNGVDITTWYVALTPTQNGCQSGAPMPPIISTGPQAELASGY